MFQICPVKKLHKACKNWRASDRQINHWLCTIRAKFVDITKEDNNDQKASTLHQPTKTKALKSTTIKRALIYFPVFPLFK